MEENARGDPQGALALSRSELFWNFCKIGLSGFGGVMPWARRALVEKHRWLSSEEFTSLVGICQFLPGPNIINLSICVGNRFHGPSGGRAATLGLVLGPFCIVIALGALYERYGELQAIQSMLRGISAVGAGLILALGLRMALDLLKYRAMLLFAVATFVAIAVLRWPLPWVMLGLAPLALGTAARFFGGPR